MVFYVGRQNSVDKSWDLLMEPQFQELRRAIYCNEAELTRFRSLLVNSVMATDIVDKELKQLRNDRWDKAFSGEVPQTEEEVHAAVNRKATIVLEHLIQASDGKRRRGKRSDVRSTISKFTLNSFHPPCERCMLSKYTFNSFHPLCEH